MGDIRSGQLPNWSKK